MSSGENQIITPPGTDLPTSNSLKIALLARDLKHIKERGDETHKMVTEMKHLLLNNGRSGLIHQLIRGLDAVKRRLGALEEWRRSVGVLQPHPMRRDGDANRPADKVPGKLTMYFRSIPFHAWVIIGLLAFILLLLPPEMWARVHEIAGWFRGGSP